LRDVDNVDPWPHDNVERLKGRRCRLSHEESVTSFMIVTLPASTVRTPTVPKVI
jgi:hypothetical protein